jgi:hypothetical protein
LVTPSIWMTSAPGGRIGRAAAGAEEGVMVRSGGLQ